MGLKIIGHPKASAWFAGVKRATAEKNATASHSVAAPNEHAKAIGQIEPEPKLTKPKLAVVEAKKAMKLLKAHGKSVTGIEMSPQGGFVVYATDPDAPSCKGTSASGNPWDEVLTHGAA